MGKLIGFAAVGLLLVGAIGVGVKTASSTGEEASVQPAAIAPSNAESCCATMEVGACCSEGGACCSEQQTSACCEAGSACCESANTETAACSEGSACCESGECAHELTGETVATCCEEGKSCEHCTAETVADAPELPEQPEE